MVLRLGSNDGLVGRRPDGQLAVLRLDCTEESLGHLRSW